MLAPTIHSEQVTHHANHWKPPNPTFEQFNIFETMEPIFDTFETQLDTAIGLTFPET